jgi:hypothetical protein
VRAVANDIHIKLLDERSDPEIARDAVEALKSHTTVPFSVTVTVRDDSSRLRVALNATISTQQPSQP